MSGANASPTGRSHQKMSGANANPTGRSHQKMSGANASPITRRADAGFSLAALIFFLTVASIFIAAAVPVYQMQAKREQEEELIFRGGEYTRAIQKYQRKFGAYPTSIDQLVSTNTLRFIRKPYKDPITGKDFRLILLSPNGALIGSKLYQQNINSQPLFGNPQTFGGQNNPQQPQPGQPSQPAQPLQQQQQPGQQPGGTFQGGGINPQSQPGQPGGMGFSQPSAQGGFGVSTIGGSSGTGQQISGGPIVGVASTSEKESIMIYNKRQKYDEWEFLAILGQQAQPGQLGQPGAVNPQPQNPGQAQPGMPQNNPFQTPPAPSSFGGAPTGSPFGPTPQPSPTPPPKLP